MSFIEFLQIWFQNDLAALGTILITIVGAIVFLYEVVQKVNNKDNGKGILFFIAYLITLLGLILIIIQSLDNIQTTQDIKSRLEMIEQNMQK